MAFYDIDTAGDHAQQAQQKAAAQQMQSDPDIQNAMHGIFTGKYADLAATLPKAWPAQIRNVQVAHAIAFDKGINDSGLDSTKNWSPTNTGTPFAVQIAPYVIGGLAGAGASGVLGGGAAAPGAAGGAGVGLGEAGATTGLAGSGFGTGAGLGYTAVPGSILGTAGAGAAGTGIGVGETAATPGILGTAGTEAGAGTAGVGLGETGATTGLASGAGLPGATALPTVGDLAGSSSAIAGMEGIPADSGASLLGKLTDAKTLGKIGSILGAAAGSEQAANQANDRLNTTLYGEQANAENAAKRFALTAPGTRLKQSVGASLLDNYQPQSVAWGGPGAGLKGQMPTYAGGITEGLKNLNPDTRALSQQVIKDQLLAQMKGGTSGGADDLKTPPLPKIGDESTWDKILGGVATGTSIAGALF